MHLPAKEFETLLLLVENNGKALSKEKMMSTVWQDAFVEEGNLAKQVSKLRKILNANGEQFIETIPKHGYRFSADLRLVEAEIVSPVIAERRISKRVTFAIDNSAIDTLPTKTRHISAGPLIAVAAVVSLVVIMGVAVWYSGRGTGTTDPQIRSIAVLPFRSLDEQGDSGRELGMGLADALITKLGRQNQIVVRPTAAVVQFADYADSIETGRKLEVDAVLEGTIQESNGRLRVNARLVRTDTGRQIWTERFEEPANEIFALQDALSQKISQTVSFELSSAVPDALSGKGTGDPAAYERFLRGRFYQSQNTPAGLARSIELYEQAIALDPGFAEAHARIADANVMLFNLGILPADETIPRARTEIARALSINSELSEVHVSNAFIQFLLERNWTGAETSLRRAIDLNPNNADAFLRYGYFLNIVGRQEEALVKLTKARELDPLSPLVSVNIGLTHLFLRDHDVAIEHLERTAAENPDLTLAKWSLGTAYEAVGDEERAFAARIRALELEGGGEFAARLNAVRQADGVEAANRFWLAESIEAKKSGEIRSTSQKQTGGLPAMTIAMRAATVKDRELTLYWIGRALEEADATVSRIRFLGKFDFLRSDPRYAAIERSLPF